MPNVYEIRRDNLRKLIAQWDGPGNLGKKLGYSNASYLVQLAGPHPTRDIYERTARKIEAALDMPTGSMDGKTTAKAPTINTTLIHDVVQYVGMALRDVGVQLHPGKFADLVSVIYQDAETHGAIRPEFAKTVIQLTRE
jgi:hypothetical protein